MYLVKCMFRNKLQLNTDIIEFMTIASSFNWHRISVEQLDLEDDVTLAEAVRKLGAMMENIYLWWWII